MSIHKKEIKIKSVEYGSDSIICEIEPIDGNLHIINYQNIEKKDVSPEKFMLTKGETIIPFHTKKHLPEYYKNHLQKNDRLFSYLHYDKKTFIVGEVIGYAYEIK